jgi:hypothetical protein
VTGFTLGNISVVGTYYTHGLNLTPRGLLAAAAAAAAAYAAVASCTVLYSYSRWVSYSCGGLPLYIFLSALFNILSTAGQLYISLTYPRGQLLPALQLPASRQLAQLPASRARIFPANPQLIVIILLPNIAAYSLTRS